MKCFYVKKNTPFFFLYFSHDVSSNVRKDYAIIDALSSPNLLVRDNTFAIYRKLSSHLRKDLTSMTQLQVTSLIKL